VERADLPEDEKNSSVSVGVQITPGRDYQYRDEIEVVYPKYIKLCIQIGWILSCFLSKWNQHLLNRVAIY